MRILAINGSHRGDKGHTRYLIDRLFAGAARVGAECEVVTLSKLKIKRCTACSRCQEFEEYGRCVYRDKDDVAGVFEKMKAADVVIYATPVYVLSMSGLLKTFFDRFYCVGKSTDLLLTQSGLLFHAVDRSVCAKPFVALVCCDNVEDETPRNVISFFESFSRYLDTPQVGLLVRNAGKLAGHGRDPDGRRRAPKIEAVYRAYERAGEELGRSGKISQATQRRANQEIIPIPFFSHLKRLQLRPLKAMMVRRARSMAAHSSSKPALM